MPRVEMIPKASWRVKVYHLENDGNWKEIGTGNVFTQWSQHLGGSCLNVESEIDSSLILQSKISSEEIYDRQNENIILWNEITALGDFGIALSFQDTAGCASIWKLIQDFQKNEVEDSGSDRQSYSASKLITQLPECNIQNLFEISEKLSIANPIAKDTYAGILLMNDSKYIFELIKLWSDIETSGDISNLNIIADIWKSAFYLNDVDLVEVLLRQNVFLQVVGALEYDKSLFCKASYREFLTSKCRHRQVSKQMNPELKHLSTKLFQLKFLKDYMLRPAIDESGIGALNSIIMSTTQSICSLTFNDTEYMESLLTVMSSKEISTNGSGSSVISSMSNDEEPSQSRIDALRFLKELFQLSRQLLFEKRVELYKKMLDSLKHLLFSGICFVLNDFRSENEERICASEILVSIAIISPSLLRKHIMEGPSPTPPALAGTSISNCIAECSHSVDNSTSLNSSPNQNCLLYVMIKGIIEDSQCSVIDQLGDTIKILLDIERMDKNEKSDFLGLFYDSYIIWLVTPLLEPNVPYKECHLWSVAGKGCNHGEISTQDVAAISTSRRIMFDVLCLCVQNHSYRMRYFIMRNSLLSRCLRVLDSTHRHMHLNVIKFFRTVISGKEDFYLRHIVKFDSLRPLFKLLASIGNKDNIVTSAIIDIVESIRLENIVLLVAYIVESHAKSFENVDHDIFDKLKIKYDQNVCGETEMFSHDDINQHRQSERTKKLNEMEFEESYLLDDDDNNNDGDDDKQINNDFLTLKRDNSYTDCYRDESSILSATNSFVSVMPSDVVDIGRPTIPNSSNYIYHEPPLPPLKSKFESDNSDSFFSNSNLFSSKDHSSTKVAKFVTQDDNESNKAHHHGISFSVKKRKM